MRKSPDAGPFLSGRKSIYTQPVLLPPQANCTASPEPLRTMLVDGTAASETIASAEAISFFVFDI